MTTIAFRDGVLAADRQSTCGGTRATSDKLREVSGYAIATAGGLAEGDAFVEWWRHGREGDNPLGKGDCALVMDLESGECWEWDDGAVIGSPIQDKFWAVGTGMDLAIGAMALGATAEEAVRVAIKFDVYSGKGVRSAHAERTGRRRRKS